MDHRCKESCEECLPTPQALAGMRTERVVLEIAHDWRDSPCDWDWDGLLRFRTNILADHESVRVVEEACPDAWAQTFARLEAERDAAIRERDKLQARVAELEAASGGNPPETPEGSTPAAKPELPTD
jgi:hypothetical protein